MIGLATPIQIKSQIQRLLNMNKLNWLLKIYWSASDGEAIEKKALSFIEDKVISQISSWQWKTLSMVWRATLVKFELTFIPLYAIILYLCPN